AELLSTGTALLTSGERHLFWPPMTGWLVAGAEWIFKNRSLADPGRRRPGRPAGQGIGSSAAASPGFGRNRCVPRVWLARLDHLRGVLATRDAEFVKSATERSEEHTSELQLRVDLVCRL